MLLGVRGHSAPKVVMPGLVPGIDILAVLQQERTWMAGTSPAMTRLNPRRFRPSKKPRRMPGLLIAGQ
jgi:hypothetical protein